MAAIQTLYRGIEYRSRLEARWAAFFTQLGWEYIYEPFDADGYIPDFLIQGDEPLLIEIKPASTLDEFNNHLPRLFRSLRDHWKRKVLILGLSPVNHFPCTPPDPDFVSESHRSNVDRMIKSGLIAGICMDIGIEIHADHPEHKFSSTTSTPFWMGSSSGQISVVGFRGVYSDYAAPYRELIGQPRLIDKNEIETKWGMACNDVKWQAVPAIQL